jgi:hypothetical protein
MVRCAYEGAVVNPHSSSPRPRPAWLGRVGGQSDALLFPPFAPYGEGVNTLLHLYSLPRGMKGEFPPLLKEG